MIIVYLSHWNSELGAVTRNYSWKAFYTGSLNTLVVIYKNLNYKASFLLWAETNSGLRANRNFKSCLWILSPLAPNCFLSYAVGKQCVASRQTSTALQVCRQLGKPLCLELFPAAVEPLRAEEQWCLLISTNVGSSHVWPKPPRQSKTS